MCINNNFVGQHPADGTFCEGNNAVLSCVIFDNSISNAADGTGWFRDDNPNPAVAVPSNMINNTRNGDVVTSVLTIENVTLNDSGTGYFCLVSINIMSNVGVISVITGNVYICMYDILCSLYVSKYYYFKRIVFLWSDYA